MPCHLRQIQEIKWNEDTDIGIMAKAFEAIGFGVEITYRSMPYFNKKHQATRYATTLIGFNAAGQRIWYDPEKLRVVAEEVTINEATLKKAYSRIIVETQARRLGWKLKWGTGNKQDEFEMEKQR